MNDEYFLRESLDNICWHTASIAERPSKGPVVSLRELSEDAPEGATLVFTYTRDADYLFANSAVAFERLRLNVQSARIFTSSSGQCSNTWAVLEANGKPVGRDRKRKAEINSVLRQHLENPGSSIAPPEFRRSRRKIGFGQDIHTTLFNSPDRDYSTLEINCPDQPGILACVGQVFAEFGISLKDARITTLGERVEDLFFIAGKDGAPLADPAAAQALQERIRGRIAGKLAVR